MAYFLIGCALLAADLLTKWFAVSYFQTPRILIPDVLNLAVNFNPGIAFSIPLPNALMVVLTPLIIFILVFLLVKMRAAHHPITRLALALMVAGGLGNLINRLSYGAVVDFIDFSFWPSFNLADAYLTCGTFLIIIFYGKITAYGRKSN